MVAPGPVLLREFCLCGFEIIDKHPHAQALAPSGPA